MGIIVLSIKNIEYIATISTEYQVVIFFMVPFFITLFGESATAIRPVIVTIYDKKISFPRPQEDAWRLATTCEENRQTAPP